MLYFFKSKVSGIENEVAWVLYQYLDNEVELMCLTPFQEIDKKHIGKFQKKNKVIDLLRFYLQFSNQKLDDNFILSKLSVIYNSKNLQNYRGKLKDMLCGLYSDGDEGKELFSAHFFKKDIPRNSNKTIFLADVWEPGSELCRGIPNQQVERYKFFKGLYSEWLFHFNNQKLENECTSSDLFSFLISEFKKEVEENLYHTSKNTPLPFILLKSGVQFPMSISKSDDMLQAKSCQEDSLLKQRRFLGARLFNGNIYRVNRVKGIGNESSEWELVRSKYFDILDSSDYLSSRLKLYYQQSMCEGDKKTSLDNMLNLWKKRLYQVISGNFSSYYAGIAFSIPTFSIRDDGSLQLLCAKGSQYKASGNGKMHVCPAGMLEFWQMENSDNLSFENFKSIAIKEFFEETVLSNHIFREKVGKNIKEFIAYLNCFRDDGFPEKTNMTLSMIDNCANVLIDNWENVWERIAKDNKSIQKFPPSLEAILKLKNTKSSSAFVVIDALNFRPEIIHPIYIRGELNTLVNWEYENKANIIKWSSIQELERWVENHYNDWCAPGLAAAYLGAKNYFEGKYNE